MQHSAEPGEPDPNFIKWLKENCVPIAGTVFGALLVCLVAHYSSITFNWAKAKDFAQALANVSQSLALIGGGVWAYFKFVKGRTFQDRLTPTVSGKIVLIDGAVFLIVRTHLHNVGLSRIALDQEVSSLVVFEYVPSKTEEILSVENSRLTMFQVFGSQDRYIESNEIVEAKRWPRVSRVGYQLELKVLSESGYIWRATCIVGKSAFTHNEVG
jgi:hypothetical protein